MTLVLSTVSQLAQPATHLYHLLVFFPVRNWSPVSQAVLKSLSRLQTSPVVCTNETHRSSRE
jgi:hypothetical protein